MSYNPSAPWPTGAPQPPGPPGKPPRLPGTGMLIAGIVTMVVSLVGGFIGLIMVMSSMVGGFTNYAEDSYEISGPTTVDGLGDNQWFIFPVQADVSASCTVTDAQGTSVIEEDDIMGQNFQSSENGVYDIECDTYPVFMGGEIPLGGILGLGLVFIIAGLVFVTGLILLIIGIVRRVRAKRQQQPPGYYPGPGYQPYGGGSSGGPYPPTV